MDHNTEQHLLALEENGKPLPGIEVNQHAVSKKWRWRKHDGVRLQSQSPYQYNSLMEALNAAH